RVLFRSGVGGAQRGVDVVERLFRLGEKITLADELAACVDSDDAGDEQKLVRLDAGDLRILPERRAEFFREIVDLDVGCHALAALRTDGATRSPQLGGSQAESRGERGRAAMSTPVPS